jgi:LEA14-like dessication related protein
MLPGGYIDGGSEQTFLSEETISLSANSINEFKVIVATISANIKVEFLGIIEKTIPLKVILNTALEEVFDSIAIPTIGLSASVDEVNEKGVIMTGSLNIFNPNPFSITIDNLSIIIASSDKTPVGSLKIASGIVPPQESKIFPFIAEGNYTLFNKDILTIEIDAEAGAIIAGLHQTVSFGTQAELEIPDIRELLSLEDVLSVTLTGSLRLSLRGIQTRISLLLDNPSTLPLEIENTILLISRIDDEERSIILQNNMTVCTIGAQNQTCLEVEVTIPYRELLSKVQRKFLPDYLAITILGDATLEGINQSLPLEINGFVDPHLFRKL